MATWRWIKGYKNLYQVSSDGRVRSVDRIVPEKRRGLFKRLHGKVLYQHLNKNNGYLTVNLWKNNTGQTRYVHHLVAEAFVPKPETTEVVEVNHIDTVRTNNKSTNLEWLTRLKNIRHSIKVGNIDTKGTNNPNAVMTDKKVRIARRLLRAGWMQKDVAARLGVSKQTIHRIHKNTHWTHVK